MVSIQSLEVIPKIFWRFSIDKLGVLVDKIGRTAMSIASGVTLLCAGLLAAFAPSDSKVLLIVALSLLGLGWNFGLISGTAQIVDSTEPSTRTKTQGKIDVLVALAGASVALSPVW